MGEPMPTIQELVAQVISRGVVIDHFAFCEVALIPPLCIEPNDESSGVRCLGESGPTYFNVMRSIFPDISEQYFNEQYALQIHHYKNMAGYMDVFGRYVEQRQASVEFQRVRKLLSLRD